MKFNNREFEQNAKTTMGTLGKLKEQLDFGKIVGGTVRGLGTIQNALSKIGLKTPFGPMITMANKGLSGVGTVLDKLGMKNPFRGGVESAAELQKAAQTASGPSGIGAMEAAVSGVSNKFLLLSTIAITAISNITNKIINAGTQWVKGFTFSPIMDGLNEYQTTLQSIQTVQANTDAPLKKVEDSLKQLNAYSDTTIYNFGQMAKNVGTFTAAGVDLKTSVASIQGIANIAALSGSSSEQAATAMYQLSQAIAAGKVGLMDWNSVVNAGMGGKKLQNALAQTAIAMGEIDKASVKMVGPMKKLQINGQSFRESIMAKPGQESWLSSDILVNTLASLDGRFSVAYQKAQLTEEGVRKFTDAQIKSNMAEARANLEKKNGVKYTDEQFAALKRMAEMATKSAQDVKTLGQVFDIAKETIGSGWAASFANIFGNLKESKKLFTDMSNGLGEIIRGNALARNKILFAWKKQGGRDTLITGLTDAWHAFEDVIRAVSKGIRQVFPKTTTKDLLNFSDAVANLGKRLTPSKDTLASLVKIGAGVASVFHIIGQVFGGVVDGLKALFNTVGGGEGDFLKFAGGIGENITKFDQFLEKSGLITTFFTTLGKILAVPLGILKGFGHVISSIFGGFDDGAAGKFGDTVDNVGKRLSGLEAIGHRIGAFFQKLGDIFGNLGQFIGGALVGIGDAIANAFSGENFGKTLDVVNTTLLGGLVLLIRNFFNQDINIDLGGGIFKQIRSTLGEATAAFENMQAKLKADILMKIAAAIGVMAGALLVLSMIDPKALTKALVAMSAGFAILITAMSTMMTVMGPVGLAQLYVISSAMTKMAASILLLSFALKTMASLDFGDMIRGLLTLKVTLGLLMKAMLPLAAGSKGMARASSALILMGVALNILAVALKIFATMSWGEMIKGLAGMAGTLLVLSGALKIMPDMKAEGIGLVLLAGAMNLLAIALKIFATMSIGDMIKGLVMLGGSLFIISAAINTMPKTMMLQAAALVLVAGAITVLSGALKIMGGMSIKAIGKALLILGGALLILAIGLNAMGVMGIAGAAALVIAAGALAILTPLLVALGAMSWGAIVKGMVTLAATFAILGIAGALLTPVVPALIGLGAAMLLIGGGFALAGAGALALATAIGVLVGAGAVGVQTVLSYLKVFIDNIPAAAIAFGKGLVEIAKQISKAAPIFATTFMRVLNAMLTQAIKAVPKIGRLTLVLLNTMLNVLEKGAPRMFEVGMRLMIGFLSALSRNMPKLGDKGTEVAVKFMQAVGRNAPKLADAGYKMLIKFINGVSKAIDTNAKPLGEAGARLGISMATGMARGLAGAGGVIKDAAVDAAKKAFQSVKDFFHIGSPSKLFRDEIGARLPQGAALGIRDDAPLMVKEVKSMARKAMDAMSDSMKKLGDVVSMDPNMSPTIAPVLDLTAYARDASKMGKMLETTPILPTVSYNTAADISAVTQATAEAAAEEAASGSGDTYLSYEQHLHSPTPLDSVTIYRDGKSLISLKKQELAAS
jgi:tape measure domain-containing protein